MIFRAEPGFVHRIEEPRYYVRALDERDDGWKFGFRWQVQFLDNDDLGAATVEFGPRDDPDFSAMLRLDLPEAVLTVARTGISDYVDTQGRRRLPRLLGGATIDP